MNNVRTPEEILDLYDRLKTKANREGKQYLKKDFLDDLGYQHKSRFVEITSGTKGISPAVNKLMDHLEDSL